MIPTVALAIFMGILPRVFLAPMEPSVVKLLDVMHGTTPTAAELRPAVPPQARPVTGSAGVTEAR